MSSTSTSFALASLLATGAMDRGLADELRLAAEKAGQAGMYWFSVEIAALLDRAGRTAAKRSVERPRPGGPWESGGDAGHQGRGCLEAGARCAHGTRRGPGGVARTEAHMAPFHGRERREHPAQGAEAQQEERRLDRGAGDECPRHRSQLRRRGHQRPRQEGVQGHARLSGVLDARLSRGVVHRGVPDPLRRPPAGLPGGIAADRRGDRQGGARGLRAQGGAVRRGKALRGTGGRGCGGGPRITGAHQGHRAGRHASAGSCASSAGTG